MPGGYLYGWDPVGEGWVKVVCNPDGELDIDATAIFENPPTEDEAAKGPSSEWAFDHKADVAAHHVKYTDANSRAAISNIIGSDGKLDVNWDLDYHFLYNVSKFYMRHSTPATHYFTWNVPVAGLEINLVAREIDGTHVDTELHLNKTDHYVKVIEEETFQPNLALFLEEAPTNGVVNKAPTSNWAFDHKADASGHHVRYSDLEAIAAAAVYENPPIQNENTRAPTSGWAFDHNADVDAHHAKYTDAEAIAAAAVYENPPTEDEALKAPTSEWAFDHNANVAAHHAKYTNAEAIAACGLTGNLYHTISGTEFRPHAPDTVDHDYTVDGNFKTNDGSVNAYCPVMLPDGVTVTAVKVYGNAGASSQTWTLYRVALMNNVKGAMASAAVETEDATIDNAVIDHSAYSYFITVASLSANDEIYAARIKFTL